MMLVAAALASPTVIDAGQTVPVEGPAAVLPESRYRLYAADSRELRGFEEIPGCRVLLEKATDTAAVLRARLLDAQREGLHVVDETDAQRADHLALVEQLGARLDRAQRRGQVAGAVGVGLGVALTLGAAWGWGQVSR